MHECQKAYSFQSSRGKKEIANCKILNEWDMTIFAFFFPSLSNYPPSLLWFSEFAFISTPNLLNDGISQDFTQKSSCFNPVLGSYYLYLWMTIHADFQSFLSSYFLYQLQDNTSGVYLFIYIWASHTLNIPQTKLFTCSPPASCHTQDCFSSDTLYLDQRFSPLIHLSLCYKLEELFYLFVLIFYVLAWSFGHVWLR